MAKDSKLLSVAHSSQNYNYQRREARMTHYECFCSILFHGVNFKTGWPKAPYLSGEGLPPLTNLSQNSICGSPSIFVSIDDISMYPSI